MILVTGASGFIGKSLCDELKIRGVKYIPLYSGRVNGYLEQDPQGGFVGRFDGVTDWSSVLERATCVIHCASVQSNGRSEGKSIDLSVLRNLLIQSKLSRVKKFIYLSSVKAVGETTEPGAVISVATRALPSTAYGRMKLASEELVSQILAGTSIQYVLVRPPVVYGAGVKGNFRLLLSLIKSRFPLPLAGIDNKRSMISVVNLVDFLILCARSPAADNQTFLVSDGYDLSTTQILEKLACFLGEREILFSCPPVIIELGCRLLGKSGIYQRLFENLVIDSEATQQIMSWTPPISVDEGLRRCICE